MAEQIISVEFARKHVGKTIAFDKIYFIKKENRIDIPKIFGYALVMSVDTSLLETLYKIEPKEWNEFHQERNDNTLNKQLKVKETTAKYKTWWTKNIVKPFDLENRVAVVPILTKQKGDKLLPQYLVSSNWFKKPAKNRPLYGWRPAVKKKTETPKAIIPELSYIATPLPAPNDKLQPICVHCSHNLMHMQGLCTPGMSVCYSNLDLSAAALMAAPVQLTVAVKKTTSKTVSKQKTKKVKPRARV